MTTNTYDPVDAAFAAMAAPAPATEATPVEGRWMLKGQTGNEGEAALIIDRYGLRIVPAHICEDDGEIREDTYVKCVYLTGEAVADLRRHLRDLWQCRACGYWMRGAGICALCQGEG